MLSNKNTNQETKEAKKDASKHNASKHKSSYYIILASAVTLKTKIIHKPSSG